MSETPVLYLQRDQPEGVPPLALTGERTLPDVPEENYWYRRHLVVYEWIAERVAGRRVVDLACGEGYGSAVLARAAQSVVGVDANPEAFEHARLKYTSDKVSFERDMIETWRGDVDAVVFLQTIEHVVLVPRLRIHLERNRPTVHAQLRTFLEKHNHVMWVLTTDKRVAKLLDRVLAKLREVEQEPDHPLRAWLDGLLRSIATTLQEDPEATAEIDAALRRLLDDPRIQDLVHEVVTDGLRSVQLSLADADGGLAQRLAPLVQDVGRRVTRDAEFECSLEAALQGAARYAVEHYGDTAVALIQRTVAEWEAKDASSRIEVAVGRDLQFIRINGTVVGALAGLAIHTGTVLLG